MVKPTSLMTRHKTFPFTSPSMAPPLPEPRSNHNGSVFMARNSQQTTISILLETLAGKSKSPQQPERLCDLRYRIRSLHRGKHKTGSGCDHALAFLTNGRGAKARAAAGPVWTPQTRVPPAPGLWSLSQKKKRGGLRQRCSPHLSLNRGNEWTDSAQRFFVLS